jgi:hypothetical protein
MGEWSKNVGDAGEAIAAEFLRLIGWGTAQHGVVVPCLKGEAHNRATDGRGTHGIDYLIARRSPLLDGVGQNLVISVKFSDEPYPRNPNPVFKKHQADLARTLECFRNSEQRGRLLQTIRGVTRTQDIGVLIWINNDVRGLADVISQVETVRDDDTLSYDSIYTVDNNRAQFIFDSVHYVRGIADGSEVTFFYPETGKNANPLTKDTHGPCLPVEFVNSSVLAFRIADEGSKQRALAVSTLEPFSESGFKRLMGLAQSLSQGWSSRAIVAFPDYDKLHHQNEVQSAKTCFTNASFADSTEVHCYDRDFRTLN